MLGAAHRCVLKVKGEAVPTRRVTSRRNPSDGEGMLCAICLGVLLISSWAEMMMRVQHLLVRAQICTVGAVEHAYHLEI